MRILKYLVPAGIAFLLTIGTAPAATYINPLGGGDGREPSLTAPGGILDTLYGLDNLVRVSDLYDQIWRVSGNSHGEAVFKVKYADYSQFFGYRDSTGQSLIFSVPPDPGGGEILFYPVGEFAFYNDPNGTAPPGAAYSVADWNFGGQDHMVAWRLGEDDYVIAWEDFFGLGDRDYNDLVVELSDVTPVPEPMSIILLGSGLAGMAGLRRKRKS
ncbi:MAG TPA: PEP-CTERM sorting domain-containing protein [Syntrophales bacterium]|nr:PEP-CTERM sorting domain-containing protein [Syntrophales bacterium]